MGRRDARALASQLKRLLVHLLKWQFQPQQQGAGWRKTIVDARAIIKKATGSLNVRLEDFIADVYPAACRQALREMEDASIELPDECPYSLAQLRNDEFWPEGTQ